jgi:hypothetical protein
MLGDDLVKQVLTAAGDDDPIAALVEGFGQGTAYAAGASGNKDGVVSELYGSSTRRSTIDVN